MPIEIKTSAGTPLSAEAKTRIQNALKTTLAAELAKEGVSKGVGRVAWKAETAVHGRQVDEAAVDR